MRILKVVTGLFLLFSITYAKHHKMFQTVSNKEAIFLQDGKAKQWCMNCGMNLRMFYKTSHAIELKNKNYKQFCSLHCLTEILMSKKYDKQIARILVVDAKTNKFIDVNSAFYVVGSKVKGTMSKNSKYAFSTIKDAQEFRKKYGGKIVDFTTALQIAKKDFKQDMMMIHNKREKMVYKKGKMLYQKKCQKINPSHYKTISLLKADIKLKKLCKIKKEKPLQAVALYLWDIKKLGKSLNAKLLKVPKKAKCPVCGMFVAKYPKWAAIIQTKNHKSFYFDGVKDMIKFYFNAKEYGHSKFKRKEAKLMVTDYYSTHIVDAKKAYYVIGANVYGPMGRELIPFKSLEKAKVFLKEHEGKKIIKFNEITPNTLNMLKQ